MIRGENGKWLYNEYGPSLLILGGVCGNVVSLFTVTDKDQTKHREDILLVLFFSITANFFWSSGYPVIRRATQDPIPIP